MAKPFSVESILDTNLSEVEPPKLIPMGRYIAKLGTHKFVKRKLGEDEIDVLEIPITFVRPWTDEEGNSNVDPDQFAEFGGLEALRNYNRQSVQFWLKSNDDIFNLKQFLENVVGVKDGKISEGLISARGVNIGVGITYKPKKDVKPGETPLIAVLDGKYFSVNS